MFKIIVSIFPSRFGTRQIRVKRNSLFKTYANTNIYSDIDSLKQDFNNQVVLMCLTLKFIALILILGN